MIAQANALQIPLAPESVHCVVTSPPYWGLRDYGTPGQLGLEPVPDCLGWATGTECGACYVCHMVAVFREVWRVLRSDGTVWLNLGDSYVANRGNTAEKPGHDNKAARGGADLAIVRTRKDVGVLKSKDLVGTPWRVTLALQADGWYLRSDIIWSKPNPMPESVTDRPTKAHEYLFLLAKSPRYYYDAEAIKEPSASVGYEEAQLVSNAPGWSGNPNARGETGHALPGEWQRGSGRNRRTVWDIATSPYPGAHYATFPPALVEPCVLAGTSARGCCPVCGAGWARVTEMARTFESGSGMAGHLPVGKNGRNLQGGGATLDIRRGPVTHTTTTGWQPGCACDAGEPVPAIVLDPFAGSGTAGAVARLHGRRFVGLDISLTYLRGQALARAEGKTAAGALDSLPMFAGLEAQP